jgi:ABC-type spermidine/putrescine transport system permease subunit I
MYGNLIDNAVNSSGQTPEAGSLVLILIVLVMVPMLYYLGATKRATEEGA